MRTGDLVFVKGHVVRFDDHTYPLVDVGLGFARCVSVNKHDVRVRDDVEAESRARAIRAVVAAQWAVGVAWLDVHTFLDGISMLNAPDMHRAIAVGKANGAWNLGAELARLPTPCEIVDGAA